MMGYPQQYHEEYHVCYPTYWEIEEIGIPTCAEAFERARRCSRRRARPREDPHRSSSTSKDSYSRQDNTCSKDAPLKHQNREYREERSCNPSNKLHTKMSRQQTPPQYDAPPRITTSSPKARHETTSRYDPPRSSPGVYQVSYPPHIPTEHKPQRQRAKANLEIEVSPGEYLQLHGSEETIQAMNEERMKYATCLTCAGQLVCIDSAHLVLCPDCRTLSPASPNSLRRLHSPAVGLGMRAEEYHEWQREREREETRRLGLRISPQTSYSWDEEPGRCDYDY
jgi:hypothetical protein